MIRAPRLLEEVVSERLLGVEQEVGANAAYAEVGKASEMPEVGRSGDHLPNLQATVHDAITVVAGTKKEILALKGLVFYILRRPIIKLDEVRAELEILDQIEQNLAELGRDFEHDWEKEIGNILDKAWVVGEDHAPSLSPINGLVLALATGIELWQQEFTPTETTLLLSLTISFPETSETERVRLSFDRPRAGLILENPDVRLVLDSVVSGGRWFIGLFRKSSGRLRSGKAVAEKFVTELRKVRQQREPKPYPLKMLNGNVELVDSNNPDCLFVILIHGLFSTDIGTFDGFIQKLLNFNENFVPLSLINKYQPQAKKETILRSLRDIAKNRIVYCGWPHDTLTSIDQNAVDLARLIDKRLAKASKIAFVCHSRGGLVARAAAEQLYGKDKKWLDRICCCITFGSPHKGVALAEHPDRELGYYILAGLSRNELSAFTDIAAYLEQRQVIEGIEDLHPSDANGEPFIRRLEKIEWQHAAGGRDRRLRIHAIGGVAHAEDQQGMLLSRLGRLYDRFIEFYSGETESDLVVPLSSSMPVNEGYETMKTTCHHFNYFADNKCSEDAIDGAIKLLWEIFDPKIFEIEMKESLKRFGKTVLGAQERKDSSER